MALEAKDKKIYDLLNDKMFIIPENQRKYVWEKNNWLELLDDIKLVYEGKINSHFIGSVVLKTTKIDDGIKNHFIIIDGQQRISTLTIVFCSMAYIYAESGDVSRFKGIRKYLFVTDNQNVSHAMISKDANPSINKIINYLYNDFSTLIDSGVPLKDCSSNINSLKLMKNVKECFLFFYESLKDLSKNSTKEITKIQDVVEDINYIDIVAKEDEDAFTIFEILNARGKPLSDFELLRNFLLKYASVDNKEVVKQQLKEIETLLGSNIDAFIKHYVTHKYGKKSDNKENRPYKIIVNNEKETDKVVLMNDLVCKAKYYDRIINYTNCSDIEKKIFMFFKQRRQQQFRPLVMGLMHQKDKSNLTEEQYNEALNYLYAFFICYNVIGDQTSNKIEDIVYGYSEKLENKFNFSVLLDMKKSMGERLPSERHLKNSIKNLKYSHKVKAYSDNKKAENVRAIFEVIERENGCESDLSTDNVNIEHCYLDSQDNGNEFNYSIGNLMLLETTLNTECKDKPLKDKIDIYAKSKLKYPHILLSRINNSNFDMSENSNYIIDVLYSYIKRLSGLNS